MWYKGTKQQAEDYNQAVTEKQNYDPKGTVKEWWNPTEIEGEWYILKHKDFSSEMQEVKELPQIEEI